MIETVVYVVTGTAFECGDRVIWIAGVFVTEDEAKKVMAERMVVRTTWEAWEARRDVVYDRCVERFRSEQGQYPWVNKDLFDSMLAAALDPDDKEPEQERAETLALYAIPLNRWLTNGAEAVLEEEFD